MAKFTILSRRLVEDALSTIEETHLSSVTDDVFIAIEKNKNLLDRYNALVSISKKAQYVNAGIARIIKNIMGCNNDRRNWQPKSILIDSYMRFI